MSKVGRNLSLEETQLIHLLLTGTSITEAARQIGIADKTARRWLERPEVAAYYRQIQQDISPFVRDEIKKLATKAIKALDESLSSRAPMVKLKASELVLNRVAPLDVAEAKAGQEGAMVDRALLPYLTDEELVTIENIVRLAEERRAEAEQEKITPMRRTG